MNRRIVQENGTLPGIREANGKSVRVFKPGTVLNILQWHQPGFARFTVEGEGAEIWFCEQHLLEAETEASAGVSRTGS